MKPKYEYNDRIHKRNVRIGKIATYLKKRSYRTAIDGVWVKQEDVNLMGLTGIHSIEWSDVRNILAIADSIRKKEKEL